MLLVFTALTANDVNFGDDNFKVKNMSVQLLGGTDREPFILDSAKALDRPNGGFVFVAPPDLASFVSDDTHKSLIRVVHGPKGCGKTSILLAKRLLLDAQNEESPRSSICIPHQHPYPFMVPPEHHRIQFDSWETIAAYAHEDTWTALWALVFGSYVVAECERMQRRDKSIGIEPQALAAQNGIEYVPLLPTFLGRTLFDKYGAANVSTGDIVEIGARQPAEELTDIVRRLLKGKVTGEALRKLFDDHLRSTIEGLGKQHLDTPIYLFVDSVDEMLRGHGNDATMVDSGGRTETDSNGASMQEIDAQNARKIWAFAQSSLFHTSEYLSTLSQRRIRLVASLRSEAYFFAPRAKGETQNSAVMRIANSIAGLQEILHANISLCDPLRLVIAAATAPVERFFGSTTYRHTATGQEEDIFHGLVRHTLEEPRDVMYLMSKLYALQPLERKDERLVVKTVNAATHDVLKDYLNFMGIVWGEWLDRQVLSRIESNVLTANDLDRIAQLSKQAGGGDHPFCFLYSLGLIGVTRGDPPIQQFALATRTDQVDGSHRKLPHSGHYLMHPVPVEKIKLCRDQQGHPEFRTNPDVIVGNGRPWSVSASDPTRVFVEARAQTHGTTTTYSARIRIDGTPVAGCAESANSPLSSLATDASILFVAFLIALKKKTAADPRANRCSVSEIQTAYRVLRDHSLIGNTKNVRGTYLPFDEKLKAMFDNYVSDNKRYPTTLRIINDYLKTAIDGRANLSAIKTGHIVVSSISASDITLVNFPMRAPR